MYFEVISGDHLHMETLSLEEAKKTQDRLLKNQNLHAEIKQVFPDGERRLMD